jgi:aspartate kinase
MNTITMKFGGTSVGSPEAIATVVDILADEVARGTRVIGVVSAMAGVTDSLIVSVKDAAEGNRWAYRSCSKKLRDRHGEVVNLLMKPGRNREALLAELETLLDQHVQLCEAVNVLGEATPRIMDSVVAFGERLSARVVAGVLRDRGVDSRAYDATEFIVTDERYGGAVPQWQDTQARINAGLRPVVEGGVTPILTGFIGATRDGHTTTLGRGGSDYSGAIFAAALDCDELVIWTDVDGVMTTDPRVDKRARVLPYVSYTEVGELAFYGAKVLHPKTVQPILTRGIPLRVKNTFNRHHPGTLIGPNSEPSTTVIKAVTSVSKVSLLTVAGQGMIGVPGIAGRTFLAAAQAGANILMISQASSEQNFCFVVMDDRAQEARSAIEAELATEIARQDVDRVEILHEVGIVTTVGAGMRGTPGVAGRVFTTIGEQGVNIIAIAQGASECSISFVVDEQHLSKTVLALHELALESAEELNPTN